MPQPTRFCSFWFASRYIDEPGWSQSARKLPGADLDEFGKKHVVRRWRAFSKNGPDSLSTVTVVQISVGIGLAWCGAVGAKSSKSSIPLARHVPSVSNVINLDFIFRTRILSPSNSSGVLRYESETVSELKFDPGFGILVFRLSDRLPRPPIAQIRRMGTEKSKGAIKKFTAPP